VSAAPLIVNMAPTGMVPTKATTPHVPLTTAEILEDVARGRELGVSMVHVHARDESGQPTHRKECFAPIVEGIRAIDPELVVCVTCSGRFVSDLDARAEVLELTGAAKPDMASLTLGSNNFMTSVSVNSPEVIEGLAQRMKARGIMPELEVFDTGMLGFARHLAGKGLIEEPCYVNILLGNLGTADCSPAALGAFQSLLPPGWTWAVAGLGRFQLQANMLGIASGGGVRVGLEDNVWWDAERTRLATNTELVERVVRLAELAGRRVAAPGEVRRMLGLRPVRPLTLAGRA
jgi:3-keto-5-aminohexanoate cleavage enzyme